MVKRYIGWDCAYKSIAWAVVEINDEALEAAVRATSRLCGAYRQLIAEGKYEEVTALLRVVDMYVKAHIVLLLSGAEDVLPGQKIQDVTEIDRAKALMQFLRRRQLTAGDISADTTILIEHQPPKIGPFATNNRSTVVSQQLAFHYIDHDVRFVDPRDKNRINFGAGSLASFRTGGRAARSNYAAAKSHSKANFLLFLRAFDCEHVIANVPTSMLDDAADAFFTAINFACAPSHIL